MDVEEVAQLLVAPAPINGWNKYCRGTLVSVVTYRKSLKIAPKDRSLIGTIVKTGPVAPLGSFLFY